MKVGILTSAYAPAPGGAANYTKLLATYLSENSAIQRVDVFTEAFPEQPKLYRSTSDKLRVHRIFPWRAGREQRDWRSYLAYAKQNVQLHRLRSWLPRDLDVLLVHAQFHYNPNLLERALRKLRDDSANTLQLILDVRDPLMPYAKRACIELYDDVICCSNNVFKHVRELSQKRAQLHLIPILFQPPILAEQEVDDICKKYGLLGKRYLIGTNGISLAKRVDMCLEVTQRLRAAEKDLFLVVAGRRRDWGSIFAKAQGDGALKYVGALPQRELVALVSRSQLHMNPSPIEGLPRASLEAMAVGTPVLLPPNVPEFMAHSPHFVAKKDLTELERQVRKILNRKNGETGYPVAIHYPEAVIPKYLKVFKSRGTMT